MYYIDIARSIISIHSFFAEGDEQEFEQAERRAIFQSTPSSQKETFLQYVLSIPGDISIHSFFAEGDSGKSQPLKERSTFQSTPSSQKETYVVCLRR